MDNGHELNFWVTHHFPVMPLCMVFVHVRTCVCHERVAHFLSGKTVVMGDLSFKWNISYSKEIVGKQKGVYWACYRINLPGPLKPAARHSSQPREQGEPFSGICRGAFLQLIFFLMDPLELEILSPAASG